MSYKPGFKPKFSLLEIVKEKLVGLFGTFGLVLYFVLSVALAFFPFVFLNFGFWIECLVILVILWLPLIGTVVNAVIWIWALVVCIKGPQDVWTIIYYILFIINFFPYIRAFFSLFRNDSQKEKKQPAYVSNPKSYNPPSAPPKSTPANNKGYNQFNILKLATRLSTLTVNAIDDFDLEESSIYLCFSNATKTDTILFSCFVLRALCIMATENQKSAAEFSREYVSDIHEALSEMNPLLVSFEKMLNERTDFYDRVFMSKQGISNKLSAISEEFEYIIITDILENKMALFSEESPMPILDVDEAMECHAEVNNYIKFLLAYTDSCMEQVRESIQ